MYNIFISQSGGKSKDLAEALQEWLKEDMGLGIPWMSEDIPVGSVWKNKIKEILKGVRIGIFCATAENKGSEWMIFEAGALFIEEIRTFPYALDLETLELLPDPISDLQGAHANEAGTKKLVIAINETLDNPTDEPVLIKRFNQKWKKLEKKINKITHKKTPADYEKILQDFKKLTFYTNRYRDAFRRNSAFDLSVSVDEVVKLYTQGKYDREETIRTIYQVIEIARTRERFNTGNTLVPDIRKFFTEHFDIEHLRRIIIRLEPILFSELPRSKKLDKLKLQISREASKVYLRYHQKLVGLLNAALRA